MEVYVFFTFIKNIISLLCLFLYLINRLTLCITFINSCLSNHLHHYFIYYHGFYSVFYLIFLDFRFMIFIFLIVHLCFKTFLIFLSFSFFYFYYRFVLLRYFRYRYFPHQHFHFIRLFDYFNEILMFFNDFIKVYYFQIIFVWLR